MGPMTETIRLYLDEDVRVLLADILRQRGYDAIHVLEVNRNGLTDLEQLSYAVSQQRAIVTHNIGDFMRLDQQYQAQGKEHYGIMVSDQVSLSELLRRTLKCLNQYTAQDAYNQVIWLHNFK
jgi:predicted nuclease of predicted toxin-antitoxin system